MDSIFVQENQEAPGGNPRPPVGFWQPYLYTTKEEGYIMSWTWTQTDR